MTRLNQQNMIQNCDLLKKKVWNSILAFSLKIITEMIFYLSMACRDEEDLENARYLVT